MPDGADGRAEAAAVIWTWRETPQSPSSDVERATTLRRGGLLRALAMGVVAAAVALLWSTVIGKVILSIAILVGLAAVLSPLGLYALIDRGLTALVAATGVLLTRCLMALVFFGVFTPFGRLLRRGRRDTLRRFTDANAESYWEVPERGRSASSSRRQAW